MDNDVKYDSNDDIYDACEKDAYSDESDRPLKGKFGGGGSRALLDSFRDSQSDASRQLGKDRGGNSLFASESADAEMDEPTDYLPQRAGN